MREEFQLAVLTAVDISKSRSNHLLLNWPYNLANAEYLPCRRGQIKTACFTTVTPTYSSFLARRNNRTIVVLTKMKICLRSCEAATENPSLGQ